MELMEAAVAQEERAESAAEQRRAAEGSSTAPGSTSPTDHGTLTGVDSLWTVNQIVRRLCRRRL